MTRAIATASDRLLSLLAPKTTAKADPCGEYWEFCMCLAFPEAVYALYRFCCRNGGCSTGCSILDFC